MLLVTNSEKVRKFAILCKLLRNCNCGNYVEIYLITSYNYEFTIYGNFLNKV